MAFDFWANFQYYSLGELVWMRNKASKASKVSYVRPLKDFLQGDRSIVLSCGRWGRARNGCALHLTQTVLCFLTEASAAHGDGIDLLSSTRAQNQEKNDGIASPWAINEVKSLYSCTDIGDCGGDQRDRCLSPPSESGRFVTTTRGSVRGSPPQGMRLHTIRMAVYSGERSLFHVGDNLLRQAI